MNILAADLECYYADDYTLSKMTTEEYIRDPRFEEILWSFQWNDSEPFWLLPDRAAHFMSTEIDWPNTAILCHHAHFDVAVLTWRHGIKPGLILDTLSMGRILDGPKAGNSLADRLVRHGLREKGDYVTYAKGKHLADFTPAELFEYGKYGCNDVRGTYDLAQIDMEAVPLEELLLVDTTVRMFTEPVFEGDCAKLAGAVVSERQRKIDLLTRINLICPRCRGACVDPQGALLGGAATCKECKGMGVDAKTVGSNDRFADLLRTAGVEPEMKDSPTAKDELGNPKRIYAFAKTDPAMQELLEDTDDEVRYLAEARVGVKSNIIASRAQRFLECASRGPMPVYINHGGAHTMRPSGGDGMNWLNMSKINAARPEMAVLRQSIRAPAGQKIVTADSGQGEARLVAWQAGQMDLIEAFAQGRDVYSEHASMVYGRKIDRKNVKEDHIPGQLGKVSILGMGFGMGYLKAGAELLKGMLGAPPIQFKYNDLANMQIDSSQFLNNPHHVKRVSELTSRLELNARLIHWCAAHALVTRYRAKMDRIVAYWKFLQERVIPAMITGEEITFGAHGVFRTGKELIWSPNGLPLRYRGLEVDEHGQASYFNGRERTKLHGSLLCENLTQHLHRVVVAAQLLEISSRYKIALWPYDEVVTVVPEAEAQEALRFMLQTMSKAPLWAKGLPLASEGGIGDNYSEAG